MINEPNVEKQQCSPKHSYKNKNLFNQDAVTICFSHMLSILYVNVTTNMIKSESD